MRNQKFILLWVMLIATSCQNESKTGSVEEKDYLSFPAPLSAVTPYDVDIALEKKLLQENSFDEAQRLFDILSWQMFISLNWPLDENGKAKPNINDTGSLSWESWRESFEIFKNNGSAPKPWGTPEPLAAFTNIPAKTKVLYRASKAAAFHHKRGQHDIADEIDQAFTAPIWDQNGNIVRYEIRLNNIITDYLTANELYNLDGQIAFSKAGKKVSFPSSTREKAGVIEIKAAWKILDLEKDIPERYYATEAFVIDEDGKFSKKKVGLVGMHITTKSQSSPQWIWATFEQVDNLETNPLKKINGKKLTSSFYDPGCSICPVNTFPDTTKKPIKNQIQRVLPIPMATQDLNRQVQGLLAEKGSFWQYYQLIGTQWPTQPDAPPYIASNTDTTVYTLPQAVTNKSGGNPVPTYLTNMIMETYFQGGTDASSVTKYNEFLGNEPAYFQIQGFPSNIDTANTKKLIFGTEGCVGCHFSASIAIGETLSPNPTTKAMERTAVFGMPGTADFDWLMQRKAHFKTGKPDSASIKK